MASSETSQKVVEQLQPEEHTVVQTIVDLENASISSELECPICFQAFSEPVSASCKRHTFCRNCLLQSQLIGASARCPICRVVDHVDAATAPEVTDLVEKLRRHDPSYDERALTGRLKREGILAESKLQMEAQASGDYFTLVSLEHRGHIEVSGCAVPEVNGMYVVVVMATYMGPSVFWKSGSALFIYRWGRTRWVVAELFGAARNNMGNERNWLYCAQTQDPPHLPPENGWEVHQRGPQSGRFSREPGGALRLRLGASQDGLMGRSSQASDATTSLHRRRYFSSSRGLNLNSNFVWGNQEVAELPATRHGRRFSSPGRGQFDQDRGTSCMPACIVM